MTFSRHATEIGYFELNSLQTLKLCMLELPCTRNHSPPHSTAHTGTARNRLLTIEYGISTLLAHYSSAVQVLIIGSIHSHGTINRRAIWSTINVARALPELVVP